MINIRFRNTELKDIVLPGALVMVSELVRPLRPAYTDRRLVIPGRPGSWDFGPGTAMDYEITVVLEITAKETELATEMTQHISDWLAGKGALVFSDHPETVHTGQVIEQIECQRMSRGNVFRITIVFACDA